MSDVSHFEQRRDRLRERYLSSAEPKLATEPVRTGGVDHLALICSDIEATIEFYTGAMKMRLSRIVPNRDDPTSTHIFLDMGGGNLLAFFDFPDHGPARTVRGVGSMHHVALKASVENYQAVVRSLKEKGIEHSIHGNEERGSVYVRDPDNIMVEVTTGY